VLQDSAYQALGVAKWGQILDLGRREEFHVDADGVRRTDVVAVFVHALPVGGQAQVADLGEADRLAGFRLQGVV